MPEFWENAFIEKQMMWGLEPTKSARFAAEQFARMKVTDVLIPGVGYGRNAKPFLEHQMSVTGIEISETAIQLARTKLGLDIPIYHGSVTDMPFEQKKYGGIFCFGLLYLLNAEERAKLIRDCHRQLAPGGAMIFSVVSKKAPMYGKGTRLGDDWYEMPHGVNIYFYDEGSIQREFGQYGIIETSEAEEPTGGAMPFIDILCRSPLG
jgi:SAM-dependent methyltransferase